MIIIIQGNVIELTRLDYFRNRRLRRPHKEETLTLWTVRWEGTICEKIQGRNK